MFQNKGLFPHPPEAAIVTFAKKIPFIGTAKRATIALYIFALFLFILSGLIIYAVI